MAINCNILLKLPVLNSLMNIDKIQLGASPVEIYKWFVSLFKNASSLANWVYSFLKLAKFFQYMIDLPFFRLSSTHKEQSSKTLNS